MPCAAQPLQVLRVGDPFLARRHRWLDSCCPQHCGLMRAQESCRRCCFAGSPGESTSTRSTCQRTIHSPSRSQYVPPWSPELGQHTSAASCLLRCASATSVTCQLGQCAPSSWETKVGGLDYVVSGHGGCAGQQGGGRAHAAAPEGTPPATSEYGAHQGMLDT